MLKDMFALIMTAKPNPAHLGLAEWNGWVALFGHHSKRGWPSPGSGSRNVIEFHGTHRTLSCLKCSTTIDGTALKMEIFLPGVLVFITFEPDVVFFGEPFLGGSNHVI